MSSEPRTIILDDDLDNADWTKQASDVMAESPEELRAMLASIGMTVEQFKALPVYRRNVDRIPWLKTI
jgi:hypothetical protein